MEEKKIEEKKLIKKMPEISSQKMWIGATIVVVVLIIIFGSKGGWKDKFSGSKTLTADEAKTTALDFIDGNLVAPGTAVEVKEVVDENGLYKLNLDVSGQEITAYITKDGKTFFPQAMDIEDIEKKAEEAKVAQEEADKNIPKTDKPTIDFYVMSFCPYGNQAEDTLKPVYELLKDKADFNFHYIVNSDENGKIQSLHGQPEVDQNEREACVLKYFGRDKWMAFATYVNANCGDDGACWEAGAAAASLSAAKISACMAAEGTALMKADEKASKEAGASGSPTMIINGVSTQSVYQYGNSEKYKEIICNAFNTAPEECGEVLGVSDSASQGGSCN